MSTNIHSLVDITAQLTAPESLSLDCLAVSRGIDNYHIDVEISPAFTFCVKESIELNISRLMTGKAVVSANSETIIEIRNTYTDIMKTTLHRSKTDLTVDQIQILQFALVKFVIQEVRDALDRYGEQLDETLDQQKLSGARSLMATQQRVAWFRKHNSEFVFRLTRLYLRALQREENNLLRTLREQILGQNLSDVAAILFNPILFSRTPVEPLLLLDYYAVWLGSTLAFEKLNEKLEAGFKKHFPKEKFAPLKSSDVQSSAQSEVYDELGGLFAAQAVLGLAEDQKDVVHEEFSWIENHGNLRLLFREKVHERYLDDAQEGQGFFSQSGLKSDLKKLTRIVRDLKKSLDSKQLQLLLASYALREKVSQEELDLVDIEVALGVVAGADSRKISQVIDQSREGATGLVAKLEECQASFEEMKKDAEDELFLRLLTDYSRYRQHLKYYRFAHRIFNRLSVITDPETIQLAKAGGNLYLLLTSDELKAVVADDEPEIVHHTILKADVRGSTTVTSELFKQGLNPASYFSLRFFNPISERLATYGAVKVFIEGDAVILGLYEHENRPDEWFSVSRACGIAKEMLDIVNSKNTHSRRTGLPSLEIGIGICYSDERPLFLFDENRPIMISSAIGDADRMSSCSWDLRNQYDAGNFNVGALKIVNEDNRASDKGQQLIRYNVNGIVLDDSAFAKLVQEVHFQRLKVKLGDGEETFYVGQYPDVVGKERDLVVRAGKVGVWINGKIAHEARPETEAESLFYEVLPNNMFASKIVELAKKKSD